MNNSFLTQQLGIPHGSSDFFHDDHCYPPLAYPLARDWPPTMPLEPEQMEWPEVTLKGIHNPELASLFARQVAETSIKEAIRGVLIECKGIVEMAGNSLRCAAQAIEATSAAQKGMRCRINPVELLEALQEVDKWADVAPWLQTSPKNN